MTSVQEWNIFTLLTGSFPCGGGGDDDDDDDDDDIIIILIIIMKKTPSIATTDIYI